MADGVKEELHVRGMLVFPMPSLWPINVDVYEDNEGAIDLTKKLLSSSSSKNIVDVRRHFSQGDGCQRGHLSAVCSVR